MLPLYDSVFAEKLSHHDLPPSFVWNCRKVPVSPSCPFQPSTAPAHNSPKTAATHSHHGEAPSPEGDKKACPITCMLATQASFDPVLKTLMKVVAADKATPEQIKALQKYIDEFDAVIQSRKAKKVAKEEKRLAKQNETAKKPEGSKPIRRDSTQGQTGDDLAGTRNKVGSGRQEEFEESSSRERAAARQKVESSSIDSRDRTGGRITAEQKIKSEARIQASWVDKAYFACKANSKNPFKNGDLLIVLDPDDYSKSCLIDSCDFCKSSGRFAQLYSSSKVASQDCVSQQGLTGLVVLLVMGSTPVLVPTPLDYAFGPPRTFYPAHAQNDVQGKAAGVKIKVELDPKTAVKTRSDEKASTGKHTIASETDWPKACDSLLRSIITRQRTHGISRKDLAAALSQIEGVVSIAQRYGLAHEVQSEFDSLFLEYVGNGKFWGLIAQEPVRCLKIGIALQKLPVYEEAFKHLVGMSANSKAGTHFDGLSDDIQAIVDRRSRELYNLRRDVNEDLLLISLAADSQQPCEYPSSTVSQHNRPDEYSTVNIFRDWMAEHIGYLRSDDSGAAPAYYLCDHKSGCNTVAGFYCAIVAGRGAYLPVGMVWETFSDSFLHDPEGEGGEFDMDIVRLPLEALKAKASKFAHRLGKSTLHLPSKDELEYLTCVTVRPEDVPWDVGGNEGECEDSDGD